jgi:hypothetical protein
MARLTSPSLLELDLGMELALIIGPTTEDPFSDEDLRIAWQHHRARMMEQYCRRPGQRPWGWWFFEAGREEHLTPYPLRSEFEGTAEERVDALIEYDIEPVVFLAANGHLRDDELAALRERANEAKLRIGTGGERISGGFSRSQGAVSYDRRDVELYEAVTEALKRL